MSGWAVFGIVLAVFVLIGCIPVGVDASYRENGLALRLKIGLFKLQVLPAKEKKKKPKPKVKKPAANKPDAKPEKPKKQGSMPKLTLSDILALADLACDTLGNLRRKLRAITPSLERLFVIKKRDIQPILDYNEKEMKLDAQLVLTITIGRAICLALRALVRFLKLWLNKKKAVSNT